MEGSGSLSGHSSCCPHPANVLLSRSFTLLVDPLLSARSQVDAKTKKILDEYIIERSKKNGDANQPEGDEIENYMDEDLKYDDKLAMDRMGQILSDHSKEMENFVPKETPGLPMPKEGPPTATLLQRMGTRDEVYFFLLWWSLGTAKLCSDNFKSLLLKNY